MNFDKYQPCSNLSEIVKTLETIQVRAKPVIMWQNIGNEERIVSDSIIHKIDRKNRNLVIVPLDDTKTSYSFEKNITLYMHGEERSIVFKSSDFISSKYKLIVPIPEEVRIIEHRENTRFDMRRSSSRSVLHRKEIGLEGSGNYKNFSINCYDISQTGMALELHAHHLLRYQIGDTFELKSVADILIPGNINGEVLYICPVLDLPDVKIFRAGIRFNKVLDGEVLKKVLLTNRNAA
jgi:c-di-GMP-binding flagellar brake protein YcgR